MKPIKNKKRRDPRYFLHEADEMDPGQEMRDRIAAHQGVESTPARSGQEIADELGYGGGDEPDVLSQAAAGDIDMLQAFAEILEIAGLDKSALADELHRLADMAEKDPNIVDPGSGQYPPRQSYDSGGQTKPGTAGMSRTEEEDAWLYDRSPEEQLGLRDDDDDPGIVLPSPGKGMTHDPMGRPGSRGGTSPLRGKAMRK